MIEKLLSTRGWLKKSLIAVAALAMAAGAGVLAASSESTIDKTNWKSVLTGTSGVSVQKATKAQSDAYTGDKTVVSTDDSEVETVAWLDGTDMYWYSDADTVYLPEDSSFLFSNNLAGIDIENFNTSRVTDMSYMFAYCSSLKSLDVSKWNTSNVTNMTSLAKFPDPMRHVTDPMFQAVTSLVNNVTRANAVYVGKELPDEDKVIALRKRIDFLHNARGDIRTFNYL